MIIGLVGHPGSGKSEVASCLASIGFTRTAFADPLKESLATALHIPVNVFYDPALKQVPLEQVYQKTPRQLMQDIGTQGYRNLINHDIWVDVWLRKMGILRGLSPDIDVSVEDVRFGNEDEAVRKVGMIVGVERPDVVNVHTHRSEKEVSGLISCADFVITNDGDLQNLRAKVLMMVESFR